MMGFGQVTPTAVPAILQGLPGMVGLPGGTFQMGASFASPVHPVTVSAFAMSETLVTNKQYRKFLAAQEGLPQFALQATYLNGTSSIVARENDFRALADHVARLDSGSISGVHILRQEKLVALPSPKGFDADDQPVVCVTWDEALRYCQWNAEQLSAQTGRQLVGRLPTEAEWEYAARAGREGNNVSGVKGGILKKQKGTLSGWNAHWNESGKITSTAPVKSYEPNDFGFFDMAGNAWEWTMDWSAAYAAGAQVNPHGPEIGDFRVLRGGSWHRNNGQSLLAAYRSNDHPADRYSDMGFRSVVAPQDSAV